MIYILDLSRHEDGGWIMEKYQECDTTVDGHPLYEHMGSSMAPLTWRITGEELEIA